MDAGAGALPPEPPAIARAVAMSLVTRYRLRLTDRADSRLGPLASGYELGAAAWTGRFAAFIGFFVPPAAGATEELQRRLGDAWTWGEERLRVQGAERCSVLLVALGPIPAPPDGVPPDDGPLRVGAVSIDPATGEVTPLMALPPGLPGIGELRAAASGILRGGEVPSLAAVDLAEREAVAGGYAAPARRALSVTRPWVCYGLIAGWVVIWLLEKGITRTLTDQFGGLQTAYPVANALALTAGSGVTTHWWTIVTAGFAHSPTDPAHILFNGLAMYWIGASVERLYGRWVLLGTFLGSVIGASLFFILMTDLGFKTGGSVLGASGGLAGLVGLLLVLGRVQGRDVPVGMVSSLRQYALMVIGINIFFGLVSSNVSNTGHLGGLVTGAVIGLVLPPLRAVGGRDLTMAERVAIAVTVTFCAVGLVVGLAHIQDAVNALGG